MVRVQPGGHSRCLCDDEEHKYMDRLQWKQENKVIALYVINGGASCSGHTVAERSTESLHLNL